MIKQRYGIVQGRLVESEDGNLQCFPNKNWKKEFTYLKQTNLSFIELLAERKHNSNNPIWTDGGRKKIKEILLSENVQIVTSCYDYIIENNIFKCDKVLEKTLSFCEISKNLGCSAVILPFLEISDLSSVNNENRLNCLKIIANHGNKLSLNIFIETLISARELKKIITDVNSDFLKCVFDTGNRITLTHSIGNEIRTLSSLIGHIHIKDKNKNAENVLLGRGMVDFLEVFQALKDIDYKGDFVFETVRGRKPLETADFNVKYCEFYKNQVA